MNNEPHPAIAEFREFLHANQLSVATLKNYVADLNGFERWHVAKFQKPFSFAELTTDTITVYWSYLKNEKKHKPNSLNRKIASLKKLLNWAKSTGQLTHEVILPHENLDCKVIPKWLRPAQYQTLLATVKKASNTRDFAIVTTLAETGMRVKELCELAWQDVKISPRRSFIVVRYTQPGRTRRVPLSPETKRVLYSIDYSSLRNSDGKVFMGQRGSLTPRGVQLMLKKYGKIAGLASLSPHQLRHTFCKNLILSGVSMVKVAMLAGHESLESTRRYCEDVDKKTEATTADSAPENTPESKPETRLETKPETSAEATSTAEQATTQSEASTLESTPETRVEPLAETITANSEETTEV